MADVEHTLSEEQQDTVDHLMSLITNMLNSGDEEQVATSLEQFEFELESIISSSPDTQKPD
jgi:hypothetical protein